MQVEYKPVSWTVGEPYSLEKIKQMTENDEIIQRKLLQSNLGLITEVEYIDVWGASPVTASPGSWTYITYTASVYIQPHRWIKVSAIVNGIQWQNVETYVPIRVMMDDAEELLYMRTAPGTFSGDPQSVSLSGARILQSNPGWHFFSLELGNDQAGSVDDTLIIPPGALNPSILSIEDLGGNYA